MLILPTRKNYGHCRAIFSTRKLLVLFGLLDAKAEIQKYSIAATMNKFQVDLPSLPTPRILH